MSCFVNAQSLKSWHIAHVRYPNTLAKPATRNKSDDDARQLSSFVMAMLVMSGRVTMLGISRWADIGGSYRTVMRFFQTVIPWATVFIRPIAKLFLWYDR